MRVVVDTNVFVSAALKDKSLPALTVHVVEQRGRFLKSVVTERQLFEVLARPQLAALIEQASVDWMRKVMAAAELVTITERIAACRDATDDKFLELAVSGKADVIVSGAPASEVIAPPSKAATTCRSSTGANSNSAGLHSVGIGELLCFAARLCRRRTFVDSEPRCTYPL